MNAVQGITFEKDTTGIDRYVRIDMLQREEALRPFLQTLGIMPILEDWEEGLTSKEFLLKTKQILRKKFNGRNQVS